VCIILSSFAAGHRKSYWNGCIQAAIIICQQICSILALVIFLLKSFKKCFKIVLFLLWRRDSFGFGAANSDAVAHSFFCVLQLSLCKSRCSGCVKIAWRRGCVRNIIVFYHRSYWNGCIKAAIMIC
jgi:hypothetical protein